MTRYLRPLAAVAAAALAAAVLPNGLTASAAPPTTGRGGGPFSALRGFAPSGSHVRVHPDHYRAFSVDTAQVRAELAGAPQAGRSSSTTFTLPTPDGGSERFAVQRTSVMQPGLAAAHPEISTWSGHAVDDPGTTVALDVTPMGFHASVRPASGQGAWYVDPAYNRPGTTQHLAYYGGALGRQAQRFVERDMPEVERAAARTGGRLSSGGGGSVTQKVYRLALVSDPTYAAYFGADNVTAEKVTLLERVNQIYNDDLAVKMVLVDDNDKLNLNTWDEATGADGPCGEHACYTSRPNAKGYVQGQIGYCDVGTLQRNMTVLGQLIGASNYDIGHIMLGVNGGGIAGLGVVGSVEKGMGCTGLPDPTGDFMAIDYVAHEMGHEFGGNHTFNGVQGACSGGNRNAGTSVEPGSGSSVMAYAGICRQDDLQPHTDPYFSQRTLDEVRRYTGPRSSAMDPVEVQDVAFRGLTAGDTITVGFPGTDRTAEFVYGTTTGPTAYTRANVERQLEAVIGKDVTVAGFGYDPYAKIYSTPAVYPAPLTAPSAAGFQVMFAGDADPYTQASDRVDEPALDVSAPGASYVHVGETAKGGTPGNRGFEQDPTGNTAPVVHVPASRTIPARTPFTLTGSGSDADGEPLAYVWEQNDDARGHKGTALISSRKVYGPLFRVFGTAARVSDDATLQYHSPGEHHARANGASRTFPDMGQILGNDTNAKTGRCQSIPIDGSTAVRRRALNCYSEFLPTSAYLGTPGRGRHKLHFRLTARDRHPGGGGVGWNALTLTVDPSAGPFLVTSHPRGGAVAGGSFERIRWAVNGTRPLARRVQILLSTDGGHTWNTELRRSTPNDGVARVHYPYGTVRHARIMVRARGNYFFDVNDHDFRIK